jgi:hypothetical protein
MGTLVLFGFLMFEDVASLVPGGLVPGSGLVIIQVVCVLCGRDLLLFVLFQ